jgi:ApaG protein
MIPVPPTPPPSPRGRPKSGPHPDPRPPTGSEALTRGLRVHVTPRFLPEESGDVVEGGGGNGSTEAWKGRRYVFAYHIRITNESPARVRLLSRHWIIVDADGERHEVRGQGVIGLQPDLAPGQSFQYESFCPLPTPWGTMEGEYLMENETGERFQIQIGRFFLVADDAASEG